MSLPQRSHLILSLTLLFLSGCSEPNRLQPISGEVFVNQQPATGALVTLSPVDGNPEDDKWRGGFPRGVVDETGHFALSTFEEGDGAPQGSYVVLISWTSTATGDEETEQTEMLPDKLRGRYATAEKSPLKAEVLPETKQLPRFDLK